MVPLTTSSGTGLAGIETSVMGGNRLGEDWREIKVPAPKSGRYFRLLNAI